MCDLYYFGPESNLFYMCDLYYFGPEGDIYTPGSEKDDNTFSVIINRCELVLVITCLRGKFVINLPSSLF